MAFGRVRAGAGGAAPFASGERQIRHAAFYQRMLTSIFPYLPTIDIVFGINLRDEARSWTSPVPPAFAAGLANGNIDMAEAWPKYACDGEAAGAC